MVKTTSIQIRLSNNEKRIIKAKAKKAGFSTTTGYVRFTLLNHNTTRRI